MELQLHVQRPGFALDVDLRLPGQGVTTLFGPSGCGKTTLLRAVAGLERARPGRILVRGQIWQDDTQDIWQPTHQRALGYVFQEASLFHHLSVRRNIEYCSSWRGLHCNKYQAGCEDKWFTGISNQHNNGK